MYYTSELIEKIVKSPKAGEILGWLPPVYDESYVFLWLLEVIGRELDDMSKLSAEFQDQLVPQTATWSLPYWEDRYGIPSNPALSNEKRRENIIFKMQSRTPASPYYLERLVSKVTGVPTKVVENTGKNRFAVKCLGYVDNLTIQRAVDQINVVKPSHLIYEMNAAILCEAEHNTYMAVVPQIRKIHVVEVM